MRDPIDDLLRAREEGTDEALRLPAFDPALAAAFGARLRSHSGSGIYAIVRLLREFGTPGDTLLLDLVAEGGRNAAPVLSELAVTNTPLRESDLIGPLQSGSLKLVRAAIVAAGFVGGEALADRIVAHWGAHRIHVALSLGRMGAKRYSGKLLELLALPDGDLGRGQWDFVATALEAMADPRCVDGVRKLLATAPKARVWSLVEILRRVSPVDRTLDCIGTDHRLDVQRLRTKWLDPGPDPEIGLRSIESSSPRRARVESVGTGKLRLGYPLAHAVGNWARWNRALYWGGDPLYHMNSDCPTCESYLMKAGAPWPRRLADRVGERLADVTELSPELIDAVAWLMRPLPSGPCELMVADIELERVHEASSSWYARRGPLRTSDDPDDEPDDRPEPSVDWPGTSHYQAPTRLRADPPAMLSVLPSQSLEAFDEAHLESKMAAIRGGTTPAAVVLGWYEARCIVGSYPENMFQAVILDGHHTVEAYTRLGRPARLVFVCPWSFSWPPFLLDLLSELER